MFQSVMEGFKMLPPYAMYIAIAIVVFMVGTIVFRIVGGIKKFSKIVNHPKYTKNPKGSNLTKEQQAGLNVGAINGEQTMYYIDSLATGDTQSSLAKNLMEYYGIGPLQTPAKQMLGWLYSEGHRGYFEAMKQDVNTMDKKAWKEKAKNLFEKESKDKAVDFFGNLQESLDELVKQGVITSKDSVSGISAMAWDMGRLVNITRACYDCKYINEQEAWEFINGALAACRETYQNWNEFATGYVVGRAMWGGNSMSLGGIIEIAKGLEKDEQSPWKQVPLK